MAFVLTMLTQQVAIDQGPLLLIGVVCGLLLQFGALYAALKKAISHPIEREIENQGKLVKQQIDTLRADLKDEHDGLGNRITPLELGAREAETRMHQAERESAMARERSGYMSEKLGALEAQQKAQDASMQKLATDLTTTILESSRAQMAQLQALQLQFATFQATHDTERRLRRELREREE